MGKVNEIVQLTRNVVKQHCQRQGIKGLWGIQQVAWDYLRAQTDQTLATFKTTLAHDIEQLKRDDISPNVRNALFARSGEKVVVDFYNRMAVEGSEKIGNFLKEMKSMGDSIDAATLKSKRNTFAKEMFGFQKKFTEENLIVDPQIEKPACGLLSCACRVKNDQE